MIAGLRFGLTFVGIQPARGYQVDPRAVYHDPDLVPPHDYLAFYCWLRTHVRRDAMVHVGKHGNLEWLPGKSVGLSETCWPDAVFGPMPHLYPFIVNDPGEGTQAKRRTQAVIIDHLMPPLTRAESYGPLRDLERMVDEYYEAITLDPRRARELRSRSSHIVRDIRPRTATLGLPPTARPRQRLLTAARRLSVRPEGNRRSATACTSSAIRPPAACAATPCWPWRAIPRGHGQGRAAESVAGAGQDLRLGRASIRSDAAWPKPWTRPAPGLPAGVERCRPGAHTGDTRANASSCSACN